MRTEVPLPDDALPEGCPTNRPLVKFGGRLIFNPRGRGNPFSYGISFDSTRGYRVALRYPDEAGGATLSAETARKVARDHLTEAGHGELARVFVRLAEQVDAFNRRWKVLGRPRQEPAELASALAMKTRGSA